VFCRCRCALSSDAQRCAAAEGTRLCDKNVSKTAMLGRLKAKIQNAEAENHAERELLGGDSLEDKFTKLERDGKVEQLLAELKQKHGRLLQAG
jgi:phage shock protein A